MASSSSDSMSAAAVVEGMAMLSVVELEEAANNVGDEEALCLL